MFNSNDLHRTLVAGIGAVLISAATIGATVSPVRGTAAATPTAVATAQASFA